MPVEWLLLGAALDTTVPQAAPPAPDPELLEFLGSWETATGEWPESPAAVRASERPKTAEQEKAKEPNRE